MYKKILSPVDGSEVAECSLDHLKEIAAGCHAEEVVLLTAIEPLPPAAGINESWRLKLEEESEAEAKDYLNKLVDRLNLKSAGINVQTVVVHGRPAGNILKYASQNKVDLIIMSTHGRSGIFQWVFGSVAEKVLRHSPVPVLIVSASASRGSEKT